MNALEERQREAAEERIHRAIYAIEGAAKAATRELRDWLEYIQSNPQMQPPLRKVGRPKGAIGKRRAAAAAQGGK